jgi:hypothetical protein
LENSRNIRQKSTFLHTFLWIIFCTGGSNILPHLLQYPHTMSKNAANSRGYCGHMNESAQNIKDIAIVCRVHKLLFRCVGSLLVERSPAGLSRLQPTSRRNKVARGLNPWWHSVVQSAFRTRSNSSNPRGLPASR